ncbi:MAG: IS1380 family transposase [Gammaproteobacteria bacterium]
MSECFVDHRDERRIEHSVGSLVGQRIYGVALGYEDVNDHDALRHDALFGLLSEKRDPTGADRRQARDKGKAVAGKSTLNRLELTREDADGCARYKKIVADYMAMDALLIDVFIESYKREPKRIVLDVDATDDPLHGEQEGRFFHGYYRHYCYLPLYIFCGDHLLCARLRSADKDGAAGTQEELSRIVGQLREAWSKTQIIVRGDSGFCRDELLSWCEQEPGVDYVCRGGKKRPPRWTQIARPTPWGYCSSTSTMNARYGSIIERCRVRSARGSPA